MSLSAVSSLSSINPFHHKETSKSRFSSFQTTVWQKVFSLQPSQQKPPSLLDRLKKGKPYVIDTLMLLPDLWTVASSAATIAEQASKTVIPTWIKTAIAVFALPHFFLIPLAIANFVSHASQSPLSIEIIETFLNAMNDLGFASIVTGLASLGLQDLFSRHGFPYQMASTVVSYTLPWAGYASRMKMPLLMRDIYLGMKLSYQLHQQTSNTSPKDDRSLKTTVETLKNFNRGYIRKIGDSTDDKRIEAIYTRMRSWNPYQSYYGQQEATKLIRDLSNRNIVEIKLKALDLFAHTLALIGMFARFHPLAAPTLSMLASMTWIGQFAYKKTAT